MITEEERCEEWLPSLDRCSRRARYAARSAYRTHDGAAYQLWRLCLQHALRLQRQLGYGLKVDSLDGEDRYLDLVGGDR